VTRVLLTGATGFIGRVAARELVGKGVTVRALVRGPDPAGRLATAVGPEVECAPGELLDPAALERAVAGCEAVAHLAARVDPTQWGDEAAAQRETEHATLELARAAKASGCRRFVFISSIAAMGFRSGLSTPAYGRAKLGAERAISALASPGFEVVVLRPPTVYGAGERYNFLALVRAVDQGLFRLIGSGTNILPLCTVVNVARLTREAALGRVPPGVHLIADDDWYPMLRVQRAICQALGKRTPRLRIPVPVAKVIAVTNELAAKLGAPLVLPRARVRTLTVDQRFDLSSLGDARRELDAPLEAETAATVADYRAAGLLRG
jgi:UDP-glucose 4-epimerase